MFSREQLDGVRGSSGLQVRVPEQVELRFRKQDRARIALAGLVEQLHRRGHPGRGRAFSQNSPRRRVLHASPPPSDRPGASPACRRTRRRSASAVPDAGPKISVPCLPSLNPENLLRGLPDIARIHCINPGASSSYWSSSAAAAKIGSHCVSVMKVSPSASSPSGEQHERSDLGMTPCQPHRVVHAATAAGGADARLVDAGLRQEEVVCGVDIARPLLVDGVLRVLRPGPGRSDRRRSRRIRDSRPTARGCRRRRVAAPAAPTISAWCCTCGGGARPVRALPRRSTCPSAWCRQPPRTSRREAPADPERMRTSRTAEQPMQPRERMTCRSPGLS